LAACPHHRAQDFHRAQQAGWQDQVITLGDWPVLSLKGAKAKTATAKTPSDAAVNDLLEQYHEAVIRHHARPNQFATYAECISRRWALSGCPKCPPSGWPSWCQHRATPRSGQPVA